MQNMKGASAYLNKLWEIAQTLYRIKAWLYSPGEKCARYHLEADQFSFSFSGRYNILVYGNQR